MAIALINLGINLGWIFPAAAITQDLQLHGAQGYRVETHFSYDEATGTSLLAEQGKEANLLNFLRVSFYDPDGKMIASYDNIVDGMIQNNYFEFNYDLNQQILGRIDLGGELAGEIYLKGDVKQGFSLIVIEPSGKEKVVDQIKM